MQVGDKVRIIRLGNRKSVHEGCIGTVSKMSKCGFYATVNNISYDQERPYFIHQNKREENIFNKQKRRGWARYSIDSLIVID